MQDKNTVINDMKKHIYALWAFFILFSQSIAASVEVRSTHMTTGDGVANNSIRYIYQDSKGFIWMGTLNGLSRYDGNSFVTYRPEGGNKISLIDHRIRDLEEDKNGFLWIATSAELFSCYDLKKDCFVDFTGCGEYEQLYSYKMTDREGNVWLWQDGNGCRKVTYMNGEFTSVVFKKENNNLPSNNITYISEDEQGRIWIGSHDGIAQVVGNKAVLVEENHDAFKMMSFGKDVFFLSGTGTISLKREGEDSRIVTRLGEGSKVYSTMRLQNDWIVFTEDGSYVFNLRTHQVSRDTELNIARGQVQIDNRGNFWIYNHTGKVWYVNAKTRFVKSFQLIPADKVNYIDEERYHIVHDSRDIVWISTYGNGLFAYDLATDELQHFESNINGFSHITSNFLQYIMEDRAGGIWVSSEYTGISRLSVLNEGAERVFPEDETLSDRSNTVRMINRMPDDKIWLGTRRGGLYIYDPHLKTIESSRYFDSNIYAVEEGADGSIWLGSRGNGLSIDGKWYTYHSNDPLSIGNNNIFTLYRDRKNRMWIGTFGGGLNLAVKEKDKYVFKRFLNNFYSQRQIRVIQEDNNGWIWVGTSAGVYIFNPDSLMNDPDNYITYNYNNGKLRSNEIKCIHQDSKGRIWVGTSGKGFSMCMPEGDYRNLTFEHYDGSDGLVNSMVQSIVEDREGKLWVATEYGISRFDPDTHAFENFFFSAYALGNVYSENSGCVSKDGKLMFGSNYGLVVITPGKIVNNSTVTPMAAFTNLRINGIAMRPGDVDSPLDRSLIYTDEIELKYFQNSFVIDFSTFDYSGTNSTKYTYRLDNYDKEWSIPSSLNFAAYKNLAPGTYKLRVKACNGVGVWGDKETVLKIIVVPPFWKTTWAFFIYAILIGVALYITFRLMRDFNTLRNRIQVEKQLTEYKLVFFTNISHEFRTPLTLIQGALEKMQRGGKIPKEMAYSLKVMDKSTQRMLRLINQLLEFRKMQNNKLALSLEETDVMAFLYEIFLSFNDAAESKNMDFKFLPSVASYKMFIDKGYLDKVTYNLLSNAFKYTPSGGKVTFSVTVDEAKKQLVISVADSGVGIPKEKRNELFKRFMQSSFSGSSVGVGLHLTHELVCVHKGTIVYTENEGGGSIFTVSLPTDISVYEEKDFLIPHNVLLEEEEVHHAAVLAEEISAQEGGVELPSAPLNKRKVLIIEDDNDVREFLKEEVGQYFEVVAEADGPSGLERARTYDADLIICDVLMPGMTGFETMMFQYTDDMLERSTDLEKESSGAYAGEASVIYVYEVLYKITGKQKYLEYAEKHCKILEYALKADENNDLIYGNAGAVIVLLNLYHLSQKDIYLQLACEAGNILIKNQNKGKWCCGNGQSLSGLSHGITGIIYALTKLNNEQFHIEYQKAIHSGLIYENTMYSDKYNNWLDNREEAKKEENSDNRCMAAWCHGAPGILLARSKMYNLVKDSSDYITVQCDIERALFATKMYGLTDNDCLCHGNLGNTEILLEYSKECNDEEVRHMMLSARTQIAVDIINENYDCARSYLYGYKIPGFMTGISGMGYSLLRDLYPELPCILALEI